MLLLRFLQFQPEAHQMPCNDSISMGKNLYNAVINIRLVMMFTQQ